MNFRPLILAALAALFAACGVTQKVSNYVANTVKGGESNQTQPAPLAEFAPSAAVGKIWSSRFGKGADEQFLKLDPALDGTVVYAAERDGRVAAFSATDGKALWQTDTDAPLTGGTGLGDGMVLIGSLDGEVIALNQADGTQRWRAAVGSEVLSAPAAASGYVFVHAGNGSVTALNGADGSRVWVYDHTSPALTLRGTSPPILHRDTVVVGFDNGRLVALEQKSGQVVWDAAVATGSGRTDLERMVDIDTAPVLLGETMYIATFQGRVAALALDSGEVLWTKELSTYAGLSVDQARVYVTDADGNVWALDRESGAALWKQDKLLARASTAPAVIGQYLVIGDVEGYAHWLQPETGVFAARERVDESRILSKPLAIGGTALIYTSSGTLAGFSVQ